MADSTSFVPPEQDLVGTQVPEIGGSPEPDSTAIAYPLLVVIDGHEEAVDPGGLLTASFAEELLNTCKDSPEPPVFDLHYLLDWSDPERWAVLTLLKELAPHCLARMAAEGEAKADIFGVVVSLMVGPADITRCERGRRAAVEAAALFLADALEPACTLISQKLRDLGVKGVLPQTILKQARNVAGEVEQEQHDPRGAAEAFVNSLGMGALQHQGNKPLRYFQDDFFAWEYPPKPCLSGRWHRLADAEFKARVIQFLQGDEQVAEVTERFVRDVIVNLKGLALLDAWHEQMPFYIVGEAGGVPPTVAHPRFLVFQNKMIDLDEAIECLSPDAEDRPNTYEVVPNYFTLHRLPFDYDPDAWCPLWEETLDELLPRKGVGDRRREVLQEFMGWS